jgi:hypothetical protein
MKKLIYLVIFLDLVSIPIQAQQINDPINREYEWKEQGKFYLKKSKFQKGLAYAMMFGGFALVFTGLAITPSIWEERNDSEGLVVASFGLASMITSYPVFFSAAKNKGKSDIYFLKVNSLDHHRRDQLSRQYKKKAKTNAIIGATLIGAAVAAPIIATSVEGSSGTIASITIFAGVFGSIPFFMASSRNKGRLSILTRTEKVSNSFLKGGTHKSVGISIPL